jgi:GH25 family lysozyme M1 (1,4-beta-N-acetylmuramidase)
MGRLHRIAFLWIAAVSACGVADSARALDFVQGIDISAYQGNITAANWTSIKNAGIRFAFARVSLGSCCDFDANYVNNFNRAIAAGIPIGPYAVGYPQTHTDDPNDAVNEANYLVQLMTPYYQGSGLLLRPVLDIELPTDGSLSKSFVSQWVVKWATTVKNALGVDPIVYTYPNYADTELDNSVTGLPLWIASYSTAPPTLPAPSAYNPWTDFKFWQYTSTGTVPGISGNVDRDVYKGTIQDMAKNFIVGFLPGDFNGDNKVDTLDYVKWRDTYGQSTGFGYGADGDLSGTVDILDYNVWLSHFGTSGSGNDAGAGGAGAPAGVPEPDTLLLVVISAAMLAAKRPWVPRRAVLA